MKSTTVLTSALFVIGCGLGNAVADVRIGEPLAAAEEVVLDFHRDTGNYFAVVQWIAQGDYSVNISTDNGATWSDTGGFFPNPPPTDFDMVVAGDYLYVAYTRLDTGVSLKRYHADTGIWDVGYSHRLDVGPAIVREVALESDQDGPNNEIYLAFITSDGALRFFYGSSASGTTFTEASLPVTNADKGLDMHFNAHSMDYDVFISYLSNSDTVHVWRSYPWDEVFSHEFFDSEPRTAISASDDNVVLAYQRLLALGYGVIAWTSDDAGETWDLSNIDEPQNLTNDDSGMVDVTMRGSQGFAAAYIRYRTTYDSVFLRRGIDVQPARWEPRIEVGDTDAMESMPVNVTWLPPHHVGIAYIGGHDIVPYFVRLDISLFSDGFESGDTDAWSSTVP